MERYIKVGKRTSGHASTLEALGFQVKETTMKIKGEEVPHLSIECSSVAEEVDLSTPEAALEVIQAAQKGQLLGYSTKVKLPNGKTRTVNGPYVRHVRTIPTLMGAGKEPVTLDFTPLVTKGAPKVKETAAPATRIEDFLNL